jgi:V8-like Glu-specific endopeptidase
MARISFFLVLLFLIGIQTSAQAIIFGTDNRVDVIRDAYKNKFLAPAIAMSFGNNYAVPQTDSELFNLDFSPASESYNVGLCPEEKFAKQNANWLNCTGFLVAEDIMVTAGHCIMFNHSGTKPDLVEDSMTSMCADFDWLFDFTAKSNGQVSITDYSQSQTARCARVLHAEITPDVIDKNGVVIGEYGLDFSIIQLDRTFPDRKVLKLAKTSVTENQRVFAVTYPSGLPMKVASNARVLENQFENFFTANLDISSGSSGGPVFNSKNEVVGIVVRASPGEDYIWDEKRECSVSFVCKELGKGDCSLDNMPGAYPLGAHVHKIEPIVKKLRELNIIE